MPQLYEKQLLLCSLTASPDTNCVLGNIFPFPPESALIGHVTRLDIILSSNVKIRSTYFAPPSVVVAVRTNDAPRHAVCEMLSC